MKHNMNRVLSVVALLMLTVGAWAGGEDRVNITTTGGGTVTSSISGTTCTLTATPASGYYLTVENLTAVKVISGSVVQAPARRGIGIDETVEITATNASADPSGVTTYTFTMPTDENISVNVTAEFQTRTSIAGASITLATKEFTYDGTAKKPAVSSVVFDNKELTTSEYAVSYPDSVNAGTASVIVTGKRIYTGTASATYTIKKATFTPTVTITGWAFGAQQVNAPEVHDNVSNGDVTYTYSIDTENPSDREFTPTVPMDAGNYIVKATIAATTNYEAAEATAEFTISKATFTPTVTITGWAFGAQANAPEVKDNNSGGNATYTYATKGGTNFSETVPTAVGEYTVKATIAATANYEAAEATADFEITKAELKNLAVVLNGWTYGDAPYGPEVTVNPANADVEYTYSVAKENPAPEDFTTTVPTEAGSYIVKATVAETDNYQGGVATKDFTIAQADFSEVVITELEDKTYTGSAIEPTFTVTFKGNTVDSSEYTAAYSNNIDVGKATVTLTTTGKNFAAGETNPSNTFIIMRKTITEGMFSLDATSFEFNDASQVPVVTLTDGNNLVENTDYEITYEKKDGETVTQLQSTAVVNVGKYNVVISGKGNYTGEVKKEFEITKKTITEGMIGLDNNTFVFNNASQVPVVTVTDQINEQTYLLGVNDFEVSYELVGETTTTLQSAADVVNVGSYNVVVTGKGNYTGEVKKSFDITKAQLALTVSLENWTYGEQPEEIEPSVDGNEGEGGETFYFKAKNADDSKYSEVVPEDAGDYTIKVVVAETANYASGSATADFTISKAYLTVEGVRELTVSITGWKYGAEHAGPTVSGNLGNADVTYTYKDGKDDQAKFSETVPTNVGSYIVKATVAESDNYFGGEAYNEFSIEKGNIPTPTVTTIDGQTYDGQAHNIITVSGVPTGTTVKYYYAGITASDYNNESFELLCEPGEDEFSATVPTTTDAGYFALLYKIEGGDNYNDIEAGRLIKVAYLPAEISEMTIDNTPLVYTGEAQTVTITSVKAGNLVLGANDYTVSYEMVDVDEEPVQVDAPVETGTYNVVVTGKDNFTGTKSATFTIVNRTLADGEVTFHEGWATYCSLIGDVNLPAGIGAYVASGLGNGVVSLTQISYIPAKEPVLLNNATTTTTDNTEYPFNLLQYAGEDIDVDDMYYYGLHNGAFMRVTGTIPEGKIYLYAEEPNAPQLTIVIDGETTGINEIETMRNVDNENVYDLMGRKVQKPSKKGLYISNGHKVVVNK